MNKSLFVSLFFCVYNVNFAQNLLLKNVHVVDVENGNLIENNDIYIKNGMIKAVNPSSEINTDSTAQIIDGAGRFVMPGMIDAHIHLFQSGGLYTRPDFLDVTEIKDYETERIWVYDNMEDLLKRYTSKGITSVVDLGGPIYQITSRDSLNKSNQSAHIYITGPLLSNYLPKELKVDYPPIMEMDSIAQAVNLVQNLKRVRADYIKVWYIATTPQDALDFYPIVEAMCQEAAKLSLPVAVHATTLETAKLSLKAGATFLVHSVRNTVIDDEFIELLKSSSAIYCPTLQVGINSYKVFEGNYSITDKDFEIAQPETLGSLMDVNHIQNNSDLNYYRENEEDFAINYHKVDSIQSINLKKISEAGLPIALGTDAGNIGTLHVSSFFHELDLFKKAGLTNVEILKSLTLHPAMAINKQNECGVIKNGTIANLLLLKENPLDNISAIEDIDLIIKSGEVIDQTELVQSTPELVVQQSLNACNAHNLDEFLKHYAHDVRIYNFPDELLFEGIDVMKEQYQFIQNDTALHCQLVNRIVDGNTVIDLESVVYEKSDQPSNVLIMYKISNNKIQEVYFMK